MVSRITDEEVGTMLQHGLRQVSVPEASIDFDSRVRARLRRTDPIWWRFWNSIGPVLAPAVCSLAATLALLVWSSTTKSATSLAAMPRPTRTVALMPGQRRMRSVDQELERLDHDTPTLSGFDSTNRADSTERTQQNPLHDHGTSERRSAGTQSAAA